MSTPRSREGQRDVTRVGINDFAEKELGANGDDLCGGHSPGLCSLTENSPRLICLDAVVPRLGALLAPGWSASDDDPKDNTSRAERAGLRVNSLELRVNDLEDINVRLGAVAGGGTVKRPAQAVHATSCKERFASA